MRRKGDARAVSTGDLLAWGTNTVGGADVDYNGIVATSDLLSLLARWGPCL